MKYTVTTTLVFLAALGTVHPMSWAPVSGSGGKVDFMHFKDGAGSPRSLVHANNAFSGNDLGFSKRHGGDIGHGGGGEYDHDSHSPKFSGQPVKVIRVYEPKPIPVAVPKPFQVRVPKPYAVYVPVQQRVEVPVVKHVQVKVEKPYQVIVEKHVPHYVEKPYPITVEKHVFYDVPRPYPVHVPVYKHVYLGHGHGH